MVTYKLQHLRNRSVRKSSQQLKKTEWIVGWLSNVVAYSRIESLIRWFIECNNIAFNRHTKSDTAAIKRLAAINAQTNEKKNITNRQTHTHTHTHAPHQAR